MITHHCTPLPHNAFVYCGIFFENVLRHSLSTVGLSELLLWFFSLREKENISLYSNRTKADMELSVHNEGGVDLTNLALWEMGKLCLCVGECVRIIFFFLTGYTKIKNQDLKNTKKKQDFYLVEVESCKLKVILAA